MVRDFTTEPEYEEKLDWVRSFVTERVEPLDLIYGGREFHPLDDEVLRDYQPSPGIWPTAHLPAKRQEARAKIAAGVEHLVGNA